jgi:hypothetical protein
MDSAEDRPPFQQTDSLPDRVGRPGWHWHDEKKALREGIKRCDVACFGHATASAAKRLRSNEQTGSDPSADIVFRDRLTVQIGGDLPQPGREC